MVPPKANRVQVLIQLFFINLLCKPSAHRGAMLKRNEKGPRAAAVLNTRQAYFDSHFTSFKLRNSPVMRPIVVVVKILLSAII